MPLVDLVLFTLYMIGLVAVGAYFFRRRESEEDFFLGGRTLKSWHIGLSVVATDVGGGFSIGLGGLGFSIGLSGSWMLFSGLLGAWLAAVFLIPRVKPNASQFRFLTFPDLIGHHYGKAAALVAGVISAVGYLGFTSSQMLAGTKLATASIPGLDASLALYLIAGIIVGYTALGGLKAVVYTDTVQWILLMAGLILVGIPIAFSAVGGWSAVRETLAPSFLDPLAIAPVQLVNWAVTIVPIWFVAMTLYQRIYASRDVRAAKRAWYLAGLFEWPIMAFMGVVLGLLGRVAADQGMFLVLGFDDPASMDPELGLPALLRTVLPTGMLGVMLAAYFSAIMSTADSCLLAASGNVLTDILSRTGLVPRHTSAGSRITTFSLGLVALVLATTMQSVLDMMLLSYAFMVSGLFVPVLGILSGRSWSGSAAVAAMLMGGGTTVLLGVLEGREFLALPLGLDPNVFGLAAAAGVFLASGAVLEGR